MSEPFLANARAAMRAGMTPAFTASRTPDRIAVISERGERTFGELNAHANQLVRLLRGRGLSAGDAVALMCSNRPEFVEVYAAIARAGFRLTLINWHLQLDETVYIARDCEARAFIAEDRVAAVAAQAGAQLEAGVVKLAIGGAIAGFEDLRRAARARVGREHRRPGARQHDALHLGHDRAAQRRAAAPRFASNRWFRDWRRAFRSSAASR